MPRSLALLALLCLCSSGFAQEAKIRQDKKRVEAKGIWLYNDLAGAYAKAKQTRKPILVSFRCIPCEECVKLDDELIEGNEKIRALLHDFVCVRIVGTNGLDLKTFQHDTDQSFAMFMLNADKTVYGRFGTRSHRTEWLGDVSIEGMASALRGALQLHANYPANKSSLLAKSNQPVEFSVPEKYPTLRGKPSRLNYAGKVAESCIHCHQIGEAQREYYWRSGKQIPERLMYPYPHPKSVGLILDPDKRAGIKRIVKDSPAAAAGLRAGDEILTMNGQPLLSMADVQWVLHNTSVKGATLPIKIRRQGQVSKASLVLESGWRRLGDTSWRSSSWIMRRVALGGMLLRRLDEKERAKLNITGVMALTPTYLGQFGAFARARRAGFKKGDVLVSYDGKSFARESDLFEHVNANLKPGKQVAIEILRDGERLTKRLPIQR